MRQRALILFALGLACSALSREPAGAPDCDERVRERRSGLIVMVHRGAIDLAVENTLAAFDASFLAGGDGVEIDIRRTSDGALVMFHDPWVDRVLDACGPLEEMSLDELLLYRFREPYGLTRKDERVATLDETLALCRARCGLIHLDIKVSGIDRAVLDALERHGLLESVVTVNPENATAIHADARVRKVASRGALIHGNNDFDLALLRERLAAGEGAGTFLVDDPRPIAFALERSATEPALGPMPPPPAAGDALFDAEQALASRAALATAIRAHPAALVEELGRRFALASPPRPEWLWAAARLAEHGRAPGGHADLVARGFELGMASKDEALLEAVADLAGAIGPGGEIIELLLRILQRFPPRSDGFALDPERARADARRIRLRATVIRALRRDADRGSETVGALLGALERRSFHTDGAYHALDGAEAARALPAFFTITDGSDAVVAALEKVILRVDDRLESIEKREEYPWWLRRSRSWWDFRLKTAAIEALGALGTDRARSVLRSLLALESAEAERAWRELHWDAARALCGGAWKLSTEELEKLLAHESSAVRRTAMVYLVTRGGEATRELRHRVAPWTRVEGE